MNEPGHERIEELLAAHALDALSPEDADAAEELLAEHVPTCLTCRRLVDDYRRVAADLALAAEPAEVPEAVLASIHRDAFAPDRSRRSMPVWVGGVAAAALVALGGLSAFLLFRMSGVDAERAVAFEAMSVMADPSSSIVPLRDGTPDRHGNVVFRRGEWPCYLVVERLPRTNPRREYQIWVIRDGRPVELIERFVHRRRVTVVKLLVDVSRFDGVWIVESSREAPVATPASPMATADV